MGGDETAKLLAEIAAQLSRIADGQERLAALIERESPTRHRGALDAILAQLDKIERTQYG